MKMLLSKERYALSIFYAGGICMTAGFELDNAILFYSGVLMTFGGMALHDKYSEE